MAISISLVEVRTTKVMKNQETRPRKLWLVPNQFLKKLSDVTIILKLLITALRKDYTKR